MLADGRQQLDGISLTARVLAGAGANIRPSGAAKSAYEALSLSDVSVDMLTEIAPSTRDIAPMILDQLKCDALYAHYVQRQAKDVADMASDEAIQIPRTLNYDEIGGLSYELQRKLEQIQPENLAAAGKIEGMTPAALIVIAAFLKQKDKTRAVGV